MKAYEIRGDAGVPDAIHSCERETPEPGPGEVRIRVRACSLNFRDLIVTRGGYPRNDRNPVVPLSDAAGEIAAVGPGVADWSVSDRVMPSFLQDHPAGGLTEAAARSGLGGAVDGVLAERVVMPAQALVRIPDHLSFEQAATLPCAAVTAWNALTSAGIAAGDTVLLLGTGGVSIFGLQLAKACGAETIITSSSDDKLARARELGADHGINYAAHPEWHERVREITGGRGVDNVLEVGGAGTLERSLQSVRVGGTISLIGLLTNPEQQPSVLPVLLNAQTVRGIYVGSTRQFAELARAIALHRLEPVIDRVFAMDDAVAAYDYFRQQKHVGKVVIRVG